MFEKVKENQYRFTEDLYTVEEEYKNVLSKTFGLKNEEIANSVIRKIHVRMFLAEYVLTKFMNSNHKIKDDEAIIIDIKIDGRIYKISTGRFNGTLLFNINE